MALHVVIQTKLAIFLQLLDNCAICSSFRDIWRWKSLDSLTSYFFYIVTSNSMLANPTNSPSVSFLLAIRLFTVIPYICEMHCPANVIMMVAVVLAPNRHQCIANHHRDPSSISGFTSSHQHNIHIPLRPLNKQYLREVGGSATCCWQWVRLLTRIMPYHQLRLSTHHSHS